MKKIKKYETNTKILRKQERKEEREKERNKERAREREKEMTKMEETGSLDQNRATE